MLGVWVIATALAGAVEWAAVSRLSGQGRATAAGPLSQSDVRQRLSHAARAQPAYPTRHGSPRTASAQAVPNHDPAQSPRTRRTVAQTARSWQLTGGKVAAACRGPAIDLFYASPLDGWTYRLDTKTPTRISLEFSQGRVTVGLAAHCVHGVPTHVVSLAHDHETSSEDSSGD